MRFTRRARIVVGLVAVLGVVVVGCLDGCRGPLDRVSSTPTTVLRTEPGYEALGKVLWSPDGRYLLVTDLRKGSRGPTRIHLVDPDQRVIHDLGACVTDPPAVFAPDGRHVLLRPTGRGRPTLALRDTTTGQDEVVYTFEADRQIDSAALAPSGQLMAVHEVQAVVSTRHVVDFMRLVDLRAKTSRLLGEPALGIGEPCWSSRSDLAWWGGRDQGIVIARPPDYAAARIASPLPVPALSDGSWSPDGRRLLVASLAGEPLSIATVDADTGASANALRVSGLEYSFAVGMCWAPDASMIAVGAQRVPPGAPLETYVLFHALDGQPTDVVKRIGPLPDAPGGNGLAWSPKGDAVAFACGDHIELVRVRPVR